MLLLRTGSDAKKSTKKNAKPVKIKLVTMSISFVHSYEMAKIVFNIFNIRRRMVLALLESFKSDFVNLKIMCGKTLI